MSSNRIMLDSDGAFALDEAIAAGTIKPGHLVEKVPDAATVRVHATEGGYAERMFAMEDALQGNTVDDAYSAADLVTLGIVYPGRRVQAILKAGENVGEGDKLISAADGTLIENGSEGSGTTVKQIIGVALEDLDLSASAAVDTFIAIRVL